MKNMFYLLLLISCTSLAQEWKTDFDEAISLAQSKNQNIILVFSGSDWCAPCIKLDHDIFSTKVFQNYSKEHYVMLKADFPRRKKNALSKEQTAHNNLLAEKYNKKGYFPLVVVLDENGAVLKELGYKKTTPLGFIDLLNN
ncbi:thiol-disulfide isomerase [Gaetbulibacter sp. 4G1]|nr:thioredoxin family protein [Gaetbulibacter sp. 4G1]PIA79368.1 thiol-disulfide isomerase [Gaetbulibacter sp. 4G1]